MRNKKDGAYSEEAIRDTEYVFEDFKDFANGTRVMFLIQRHKDGGETNNTKLTKLVSSNPQEFKKNLEKLMIEKYTTDLPLRIYSSANPRDMEKAIREFKRRQLDGDYANQETRHGFYLDFKNQFISCLMIPSSKADSSFIIDIDDKDQVPAVLKFCEENDVAILKSYATKNGWHTVTKPFNPDLLMRIGLKDVEIQKDGLLSLSH